MTSIATRESICELLPHGANAVGIDSILESSPVSIVALAKIGSARCMLDENDRFIPEATLELVGQAAALGKALAQRKESGTAKTGVIAHVREYLIDRSVQIAVGDEITVSARWDNMIDMAMNLEGEVRRKSDSRLVAKLHCTVFEK